ncbi:hypothetical protein J7E83_17795 [Arthrobacter sp. ISL-48]|uniref:hypothetical protein n=1 Tax=Arthrobacter sp. ISL-48 TaxID=2819110 RepID=UPI001BE6FBE7|nr:hypothetical protein [Arthrobacter sp. ISL-48]MBT2533944.1 hypothetical protein [Arthrobacter sp. ISL-48]
MDGLHEVATAAAAKAGWTGAVLPAQRVSSFLVFPVVEWLPGAAARLTAGQDAQLDATILSMWESWPLEDPGQPPSSPLRVEGFVIPHKWKSALNAAVSLSGYGKVMALTGANREKACSSMRLMEADLAGLTVVHAEAGNVELQVRGRAGRHPRARRSVSDRYFEELFFARACTPAVMRLSVSA